MTQTMASSIRIAACRSDGRCPECGQDCPESLAYWACGCLACNSWRCEQRHLLALLTEALQQRDTFANAQKRDLNEAVEICYNLQCKLDKACEERDAAIRERDLARAHDAQPYPTAEAYERVCAALEQAKRSLEQTRAAMEVGDACTVCAGTGKPVSGKPCICGGHGGIGNQIIGLTREVQRERERAAKSAEQMTAHVRYWLALAPEVSR